MIRPYRLVAVQSLRSKAAPHCSPLSRDRPAVTHSGSTVNLEGAFGMPKNSDTTRLEVQSAEVSRDVGAAIAAYAPKKVHTAVWAVIAFFIRDVVTRSSPMSVGAARARMRAVTLFTAWAMDVGTPWTSRTSSIQISSTNTPICGCRSRRRTRGLPTAHASPWPDEQ